MLFLFGTGLFLVLMWQTFTAPKPAGAEISPVSEEAPDQDLPAMDMVALDALGPLPSYEAVKARAGDLDRLLNDPQLARYSLKPVDDLCFAWVRAQLSRDRETRPVMQAHSAEDLVFKRVTHGRAVLVSGTLVEVRDAQVPGLEDEEWLRATVALDNADDVPVFLYVLAPKWAAPGDEDGADGLSPGLELRVVGRYLGTGSLPTSGGGKQNVPVIAASALAHASKTQVTDLLALPDGTDGATWNENPEVFDSIDDYPGNPRQSVLERRPYYYLLGQVRLDMSTPGAFGDAKPMDVHSEVLYRNPSEHRGEVYTVRGKVWDAWMDDQVRRDQPYGVGRVMRIWLYRTVFGIGDKPFRDLYEVAILAPGDSLLPKRGEEVEVTGRFMKVQLYHTPASNFHYLIDDQVQQNEDVLFKFIVAPSMKIIPEASEMSYLGWKIVFLVVSFSFFALMGFLIFRDERHDNDYRQGVRKIRATRRRLKQERMQGSEGSEGAEQSDSDLGEDT
jgi:hypothetical protein